MKRNVIDNSKFPIRKVVSFRSAKNPGPADLSHLVTLECGHEVGVTKGAEIPTEVPCYWCDKEGKR